jgi:hypothetical protein
MTRILGKLVLLACCLPALMGAEVYRWVDDQGVVNYTQQQPANRPSERIVASQSSAPRSSAEPTVDTAAAPPPTAADGGNLSDAQLQMLENLRAAEAARQQEVQNIRQSNCEAARALLGGLTARGRIRVRDDDGQEQVMAEEERQQRISDAQQAIAENCVGNSG